MPNVVVLRRLPLNYRNAFFFQLRACRIVVYDGGDLSNPQHGVLPAAQRATHEAASAHPAERGRDSPQRGLGVGAALLDHVPRFLHDDHVHVEVAVEMCTGCLHALHAAHPAAASADGGTPAGGVVGDADIHREHCAEEERGAGEAGKGPERLSAPPELLIVSIRPCVRVCVPLKPLKPLEPASLRLSR